MAAYTSFIQWTKLHVTVAVNYLVLYDDTKYTIIWINKSWTYGAPLVPLQEMFSIWWPL